MSQFNFSLQFSQRWLAQPAQAREAIMQTLADTVILLAEDTDTTVTLPTMMSSSANQADAHEIQDNGHILPKPNQLATAVLATTLTSGHHSDSPMLTSNATMSANKGQASKQSDTDTHITATKVYTNGEIDPDTLNRYKIINENPSDNNPNAVTNRDVASDASKIATKQETDKQETDALQETNSQALNSVEDSSQIDTHSYKKEDNHQTDTSLENGLLTAQTSSSTRTELNTLIGSLAENKALDSDLVKELERLIDDYLSEQMASMSENIKAWLHEQINRPLAPINPDNDDSLTSK